MAEPVKTFDFDIQPSTLQVPGKIPPGGTAEVTFQVCNTSNRPLRAEVIIDPQPGPTRAAGVTLQPGEWAYWLSLVEPPEYDYQPQSILTYTVHIQLGTIVTLGTYSFRLLVVGLDDPDHEYIESQPVSFSVANPPYKTRPLLTGAIALFALALIGSVIYYLINRVPPALNWTLTPPKDAKVGELAEYKLELKNPLSVPIRNVVMDYTYPDAVRGAWANVVMNPVGPTITRCSSTQRERLLRCALGDIEPHQKVTIFIYVLPGPKDPHAPDVDNENKFALYWVEHWLGKDQPQAKVLPVKPKLTPIADVDAGTSISGGVIPAVDVASVGMPVKISLLAWHNIQDKKPIKLQYTLPQGMRFEYYPTVDDAKKKELSGSCKQTGGSYFILECTEFEASTYEDRVQFDILVVPLEPSVGYEQKLLAGHEDELLDAKTSKDLSPRVNDPKTPDDKKKLLLPAVNSQLVFNGVETWAQLGYAEICSRFTVEMWINPATLEDGQAFLGAHRQGPDKVDNIFLVGYYNGSLNVNVNDEYHNLGVNKMTGPFHLAIVVDPVEETVDVCNNKNQKITGYNVTAYINGVPQPWQENDCSDKSCDLTFSKPFEPGETFNWVVGQDWDANGNDIAASDFFRGTVGDIRIWSSPRTSDQIADDMFLPPCGDQTEGGATCKSQGLLGWWQLAPPNTVPGVLPVDCRLPVNRTLDPDQVAKGCALMDLSPRRASGARSGASWASTNAHFGNALAFDGSSALRQEKVTIKYFGGDPIAVTLSAWLYVDAVPSYQQWILGEKVQNGGLSYYGMMLDKDGHVAAVVGLPPGSDNPVVMKDEKPVTAGHWVHYAMVFKIDRKTGALVDQGAPGSSKHKNILLFRDSQKVKGVENSSIDDPSILKNAFANENTPFGFFLGGIPKANPSYNFIGRIDEVRIWNKALYDDTKETDNTSPAIDLWRRRPGVVFNEYVYWSFDDDLGRSTNQPCAIGAACDHSDSRYQIPIHSSEKTLDVSGPSWIPNDLSIGCTAETIK